MLAATGTHVASTDEMTGIQALERLHPSLPMQPGHVEREEFEYQRHGTLSLLANLDVATGQIVAPSIGPTRTEADFAAHIAQTIRTDPQAAWIFVTDQLNTHQSETLVRLVAAQCGIQEDLGIKGKRGHLANMGTRAAFLSDTSHRIRFVYTPTHRRSGLVSLCDGCWHEQAGAQSRTCAKGFSRSLPTTIKRPTEPFTGPTKGLLLTPRSNALSRAAWRKERRRGEEKASQPSSG